MLNQVQHFIKTSELRQNLAKYLKMSATEPVIVSAGHSSGVRVLVDSKTYNALVEAYEDHQDADTLKALVAENSETVSWSDVKKANGV